jgi:hypothetical protein
MSRSILSVALLLIASVAHAADAPAAESVLRRVLPPAEFTQAGLDKLSPAELAALEASLARHQPFPPAAPTSAAAERKAHAPAKAATSPAAVAAFGAEQVVPPVTADTPAELRTHIEGTIQDFSGRAVFALANGQIWQQRMPDEVHFPRKLVNPEVVITRSFGGYKMVIVPADYVVFVKRIQ